jgi:excinuclease UvrABC nuclease subunit
VLRGRLGALSRAQRFEDAARLRDRLRALEAALESLDALARARSLAVCLLVPDRDPRFVRAVAVVGGRVATRRSIPRGAGAVPEAAALVADALHRDDPLLPQDADELLLVDGFLRRPPPELVVVGLEVDAIVAGAGIALAA